MYFFGPPKLQSRTTKGKLIGGPNVHQCTKYYFEDWTDSPIFGHQGWLGDN